MLTIFGLYVYATIGILKILNLTDNKKDFIKYVSSIMVIIFLFTIIYIIGISELFKSHELIMSFYEVYIIINLIYLLIGNILNYFINFNFKN